MLDRSEDIATTGQRHPCLAKWKVGFTKEGMLVALKTECVPLLSPLLETR